MCKTDIKKPLLVNLDEAAISKAEVMLISRKI